MQHFAKYVLHFIELGLPHLLWALLHQAGQKWSQTLWYNVTCMGSRAVHIEINHSLDRFFYSSPKESHCQEGKYQNSFFRQWQQFYWLWKWIEKGIWRNGKSENPVIYLRSRRRQDKVVRNLSAASHMGGFGRDKSGMLMQFSCYFLKHMENHLTNSHF